jgi:hypothetical protein
MQDPLPSSGGFSGHVTVLFFAPMTAIFEQNRHEIEEDAVLNLLVEVTALENRRKLHI